MKNISRRSISLVLIIAMIACALAACGGSSAPADQNSAAPSAAAPAATGAEVPEAAPVASETDETLTVALNTEPTGLTGLLGAGTEAGLIVMDTLSATLYAYDGDSRQAVPGLASGYETIDELHYRFTLRDDVCYSDGTPVTAEDVLYSFTKYAESGIANASYFNIDEFAVEDEKTIVIAFKRYVPGWLYLLSESSMAVFSEAAVNAVGGPEAAERQVPASCGPYKFVEWKAGEYILVERNENYWDKDSTHYYQYIKFIFISDAASRALAVQSGDADVAYRVATTDYVAVSNIPGVEGYEIPSDVMFNVIYNCSSEKLSNAKLREAISYCIDPYAVNALVTMGQGQVAQGLWSPNFPYMHDVYPDGVLPYDPAKAQTLLAEAGYPNGVDLKAICLPANANIATIVQENLRQIGVEVEINIMEQSVYVQEARAGNYDMQFGNTNVGTVQPNAFNPIDPAMEGISIQSCRIQGDEIVELVKKASSADEATMEEGFNGIIDYVFNNYCLRGLCTDGKYCIVKEGIRGLNSCSRMGYLSIANAYK